MSSTLNEEVVPVDRDISPPSSRLCRSGTARGVRRQSLPVTTLENAGFSRSAVGFNSPFALSYFNSLCAAPAVAARRNLTVVRNGRNVVRAVRHFLLIDGASGVVVGGEVGVPARGRLGLRGVAGSPPTGTNPGSETFYLRWVCEAFPGLSGHPAQVRNAAEVPDIVEAEEVPHVLEPAVERPHAPQLSPRCPGGPASGRGSRDLDRFSSVVEHPSRR